MDTSSVCRPFGNSSSSAPTSANVVDVSSSHACGIAAKSSDHDGIATTADRNYNYGKRHFPGWRPIIYGEWQIYPNRRERRHDVLWRGEETREEVTLENSTMLGRKRQEVDIRVPPNLHNKFAEMWPLFKNREVDEADIPQEMMNYLQRTDRKRISTKKLLGTL
ncbi:uncharacterized protein LOC134187158 [Corticium candelabrum]|uniref:uncharacterized protein LOC134187158 n=1 Tax=Corticium candelabrum TaxID=121492 RepID=UPI002E266D5A|nr:uncharacterized protein LOC134187158 [Corticium candelabrum]